MIDKFINVRLFKNILGFKKKIYCVLFYLKTLEIVVKSFSDA